MLAPNPSQHLESKTRPSREAKNDSLRTNPTLDGGSVRRRHGLTVENHSARLPEVEASWSMPGTPGKRRGTKCVW
jgi:hypothetical protein